MPYLSLGDAEFLKGILLVLMLVGIFLILAIGFDAWDDVEKEEQDNEEGELKHD